MQRLKLIENKRKFDKTSDDEPLFYYKSFQIIGPRILHDKLVIVVLEQKSRLLRHSRYVDGKPTLAPIIQLCANMRSGAAFLSLSRLYYR